ncbi:MAG: XRE family transcriptional regulator, partial [Actinobacteria bacterium]|nr:XRE family transcriptional regulator [Actinomycetota bacterium]
MTHIGHRLHQIRKERGLRLSDVARDIVSVGYLSMIEQGQRTPSSQVLRALAARLDVDQAVLESGSFASARLADVIELQEAMWHHVIGDYPEAIRRYRYAASIPASGSGWSAPATHRAVRVSRALSKAISATAP